jgi:hypothetical protein
MRPMRVSTDETAGRFNDGDRENRMSERNRAALTVSVDLPSDPRQTAPASRVSLAVGELIDVFAEYRLSATWSLSDPGASPWTDQILRSQQEHEIALLADAGWVTSDRTRFANELGRRLDHAAAIGLNIGALAFHHVAPPGGFDLLVRHRLPLIRADVSSGNPTKSPSEFRALSTRFGIWLVPVTAIIAGRGWWLGSDLGQATRSAREALERGRFVHVVLDFVTAATHSSDPVALARRFLKSVHSWKSRGQLRVVTLADAAHAANLPVPAQSVLRRRAA